MKSDEKLDVLIGKFRTDIIPSMQVALRKHLTHDQRSSLEAKLELYSKIYTEATDVILELRAIRKFLEQICKSLEKKDIYNPEEMTIKPKNLSKDIQYFAVVLLSLFAYSDDYGFSKDEKRFFMELIEKPDKIKDII
jgi:hypothetical protein